MNDIRLRIKEKMVRQPSSDMYGGGKTIRHKTLKAFIRNLPTSYFISKRRSKRGYAKSPNHYTKCLDRLCDWEIGGFNYNLLLSFDRCEANEKIVFELYKTNPTATKQEIAKALDFGY